MSAYLIIANGDFLIKEIILAVADNKIIIALDGAIDTLSLMGLKPQIILGDFDSISEKAAQEWGIDLQGTKTAPYPGLQGALIVPAHDQNYTDLEKALEYCRQQQASSIAIVCATGDRLDHQESVKMSLKTYYQKNCPIILYTEQQCLYFAENQTLNLQGQAGDKCGFIGTPNSRISSLGLNYECQDLNQSFCNSLAGDSAQLTIQGQAWIFAPPSLSAQREYMKKSSLEKLCLHLRDRGA